MSRSIVVTSLIALSVLQTAHPATLLGRAGRELVTAAWYAGFHADQGFPLSAVSWDKYNTVIYSFAITTPNVAGLSLDGSDRPLLPEFVREAHTHVRTYGDFSVPLSFTRKAKKGVAAHISIGGGSGGGIWFSTDVATAENRTAFVKTITDFARRYDLDGINFDWEYPNKQGLGCNTISPNDTEHFLAFLQDLRGDPVGATLTLSAATQITPFRDASGEPSKNISGFADVLDYIAIMNYDVWGPWSPTVGPNALLNDTCVPPAERVASAVSAVDAWTAAGMPLDQIVLGVPSYGHSFSVRPQDAFVHGSDTELAPFPKFNGSNQPLGDAWDDTGGINACGVYQGPGGTFELWGLVQAGFLDRDGQPAPGIAYQFDECSHTPYVYNKTSEVMVSFDDTRSFTAKGKYIRERGLRGFAMWEAGGDYKDMLLDAIELAIGFDA